MTKRTMSERQEIWRLWRQGLRQTDIAARFSCRPSEIHYLFRRHGGFQPKPRSRNRRHLSQREREEVSRGLVAGCSYRAIAKQLGRAPSTIQREVHRNGGPKSYRAYDADEAAWKRARRPKPCKLARKELQRFVERKLRLNWSPQQISRRLKRQYSEDPSMQISHEAIYQSLFIQARGTLKKELLKHLRSKKKMRSPQMKRTTKVGGLRDLISIRQRPAEAEDRAVPGHWEGDLIQGKNFTYIATLVERHSRFVMLIKLDSKDSQVVAKKLAQKIQKLPAELKRSLTWDRGTEMAQHKQFTLATKVQVYFCDPHSPWQRGSNENTNGLLRQYFPKGTDLSVHSQAYLNKVARELNERPRFTLGDDTPAEALHKALQ